MGEADNSGARTLCRHKRWYLGRCIVRRIDDLTGSRLLCGSVLARDAGGDEPDAIAGKPAPTSCLRSHTYTNGCRDLGGSWLASDRALPGATCVVGKPYKLLAQHT